MNRLRDLARLAPVLAVREAFILALPAIVAMNLLQVLLALLHWLLPHQPASAALLLVEGVPQALRDTLAYLFLIALTDVLARRGGVNRVVAAMTAFIALVGAASLFTPPPGRIGSGVPPLLLLSIPVAWLTVKLLRFFMRRQLLRLVGSDAPFSPTMVSVLQSVPAAACTLPCVLLVGGIAAGALHAIDSGAALPHLPATSSPALQLTVYTLTAQLLWFVGLHGSNMAEAMLHQISSGSPPEALRALFSGFMHLGGAGSTLGLVIAGLLQRERSQMKSVCRLGLPFALVNVNELLIFGLPIAFNPLLLVPFLLAPVVNGWISLAAVDAGLFTIVDPNLSWLTPPLVAAWFASGGSPVAVGVQALCLLLDVLIYLPFVRLCNDTVDSYERLRPLFALQSAGHYVTAHIESRSEDRFVAQQLEAHHAELSTRASLKMLEGGRFAMVYQPKFELATGRLCGGEALLRLIDAEGKMRGPTFLPDLYRLGLSGAIDDKVVDLVFEQLDEWQSHGFASPRISINLDRDYLHDAKRISALIERAARHPGCIEIEVTEHNFMRAEAGLAETVSRVRAAGITVSLDDFGAGYSSLGRLVSLECDEVKLDRALIVPIETPRGFALVRHIVAICRDLGYGVVAEGVETEAQRERLREAQVGVVQGYLTGRPIPATEFRKRVEEDRALEARRTEAEVEAPRPVPSSGPAATPASKPAPAPGIRGMTIG